MLHFEHWSLVYFIGTRLGSAGSQERMPLTHLLYNMYNGTRCNCLSELLDPYRKRNQGGLLAPQAAALLKSFLRATVRLWNGLDPIFLINIYVYLYIYLSIFPLVSPGSTFF